MCVRFRLARSCVFKGERQEISEIFARKITEYSAAGYKYTRSSG